MAFGAGQCVAALPFLPTELSWESRCASCGWGGLARPGGIGDRRVVHDVVCLGGERGNGGKERMDGWALIVYSLPPSGLLTPPASGLLTPPRVPP